MTTKPLPDLNIPPQTLMQGDNLGFLRALNSECIDLIATDPPFNKGKDFHATPDSLAAGAKFQDRWSWDKDVDAAWVDEIQDDWPGVWAVIDWTRMVYGDDMGAFLCWLGVRLLEMHRVLKPTGSLWLHCDDTASHYIKALLDAVFGRRNYKAEATWRRHKGAKGTNAAPKNIARNADTLFWYTKSDAAHYRPQYTALSKAGRENYKFDDGDGKGVYRLTGICFPGGGGYEYDLGYGEKPPKNGYGMVESTAREWIAEGLLVVRPGRVPMKKKYLSDCHGAPLTTLWDDVPAVKGTNDESTGYPTQKPIDLYKRVIETASDPGDVVLDPFCGCATTLIAAQQLDRRWLGIDLWPTSIDLVRTRLTEECPMFSGTVYHTTTPPDRSDGGDVAAPHLPAKMKRRVDREPTQARQAMVAQLHVQQRGTCAGCDRRYDDPRIWHLDHRIPRSEGGGNDIENRLLLCPPCNGIKSNTLTLTGLRKRNKVEGWMAT